MTRNSSDELMEEINISDTPIKDRQHHSRRGHLAQDSQPIDDDAINEELHNVIATYWKNRQKPGFVGYKGKLEEDEEEEVRIEEDLNLSFLKNPRRTKMKSMGVEAQRQEKTEAESPSIIEESKEAAEEPLKNDQIIALEETSPARSDKPEVEETTEAVIPEAEETIEVAIPEAEELIETAIPMVGKVVVDSKAAESTTEKVIAADETVIAAETATEKKAIEQSHAVKADTEKRAGNNTSNITTKKKRKKKKGGPGRVLKWIFTILVVLLIGGSVTFGVVRYIGWRNTNRTNDSGEDISTYDKAVTEDGGKTVVYNGVTYLYNEELSTILFIGVDKEQYEEEGVSGEAGQADTVILTVVNQKTGETRMIPISRSTMVAVDQYNTDGSYWKQENVQLAVSFAYGTNIDENCKNVAKAVSRILYGMPVHRYVTMDLSAIPQLNDAVGGVTVDCLEDMTDVDETWVKGAQITLHGKQAETYVRHRKTTISDENQDNNAPRMERQKQFLNNFIHTLLSRMKGDIFVPLRLYRDVGDDIYSDVTTAEIVYYTSMVVSKGFNNSVLSIEGSVKHNEFTEFYPDEEKVYQLILDTFYERQ